MEIINKSHDEITYLKKMDQTYYLEFHAQGIYFSSAATLYFKMKIGMFAHFVIEEGNWYFAVNNQKDGFEIKPSSRRNAVAIYNTPLANLFIRRTSREFGTKYILKETEMELYGGKMIEICIDKPLRKVRKGLLK